jgi:hypothetical protein
MMQPLCPRFTGYFRVLPAIPVTGAILRNLIKTAAEW